MPQYMLVAADAARARIFSRGKKFSPLIEVDTLLHPESRLRKQDLESDRPSTVHESAAYGESASQPRTDAKQKEFHRFAHELAAWLKEARLGGRFKALTLVAEPSFLGQLRKALDDETRKLVIKEVTKNVVGQDALSIARLTDGED